MKTYDNGKQETHGTCPYCLAHHRVNAKGRMYRHGWNAFNVRHGEMSGWHTGACQGTKMRPIEETDEDALQAIADWTDRALSIDAIQAKHEAGEVKSYRARVFGANLRDKSDENVKRIVGLIPGIEFDRWDVQNRYGVERRSYFFVKVTKEWEGLMTSEAQRAAFDTYLAHTPAFENLRADMIHELQEQAIQIRRHIARIEAAIEEQKKKAA